MKILIILTLLFALIALSAQTGYVWERHSFNAAGGAQTGTIYTSVTSFGNIAQGEVSSTNYNGYLGFLFPLLDQRIPVITSVDDVPNDQGHQVQIVWNKCGFDDYYQFETYYSVWRLDEDFARTSLLPDSFSKQKKAKKKVQKKLSNILSDPTEIVELARQNPDEQYFWQSGERDRELWTFVSEVPALQENAYSFVAPTILDSSAAGTNYSTFKVIYHDRFEFYEAVPDSGYSTDDIAPDATANVAIALNQSLRNSSVTLSWDEVTTGTFEGNIYEEINGIWYRIYAADSPGFACDENTLLETVTETEYECDVSGHPKQFFKVVVSDKP